MAEMPDIAALVMSPEVVEELHTQTSAYLTALFSERRLPALEGLTLQVAVDDAGGATITVDLPDGQVATQRRQQTNRQGPQGQAQATIDEEAIVAAIDAVFEEDDVMDGLADVIAGVIGTGA